MPLDLAEECGPMLGGAEIARGQSNLKLTIETVLTLGSGVHWGLRVEKPRWSETGRALKSEHVILLIATHGESPPDLLRQLAGAWEQGEVDIDD